jgi:hypothetical protein
VNRHGQLIEPRLFHVGRCRRVHARVTQKGLSGPKGVIPSAPRLIEDQYADEQVRNAVVRLRDVYQRVSRQQADVAADRKLYRSLREAATSIRNVVRRGEEPPPPKRTGRKVLIAGVSTGVVALVVRRRRGRRREAELPIELDATWASANSEVDSARMAFDDRPAEQPQPPRRAKQVLY